MEGSRYFAEEGSVYDTLRHITQRLHELNIPYAVCGGLALAAHGFRRFTEDVDLLVTKEDLQRIHHELRGRGFLPPFDGSKHLRDTDTKVRVEFLVAGGFPGDGKPKPVAFPDPTFDFLERNGVRYLGLRTLIELKLASGMSAAHRAKDLVDVQELIQTLNLPREFGDSLNAYVADRYRELWDQVRGSQRRFVSLWKVVEAKSRIETFDDAIANFPDRAETIRAMQADGVTLEPAKKASSRHFRFVTTDAEVAAKYEMSDEADFLEDER